MDNEGYEKSFDSSTEEVYYESQATSSVCDVTDATTQTESAAVPLRSWKIERTSHQSNPLTSMPLGSRKSFSLLPDNSEIYVIETRSLGFHASSQTLDDDVYKRSKAEMIEIVTSWRVLTILFPSFLYLIIYFLDQLLDIIVCVQFCTEGDSWWCGFGLFFLLGPSLLISIFAYEQLTAPDIANIKPLKKKVARVLCVFQLTPYYLIGRKVWWGLQAWFWSEHREERFRSSSKDLWEKGAQESDSTTCKLFQSLFESVPQLSLQSYALLRKLNEKRFQGGTGPSSALRISCFVNLLSASSGLASSQSQNMFERFAGSVAVLVTLGTRVLICGGVGTLHPVFWFVPIMASFLLGLVTKISESVESSVLGHVKQLNRYAIDAIVMASVSPPFDATGFFCSCVYVLAAFIFLMENPSHWIHVLTLVLSVFGQVVWVLLGFCLMGKHTTEDINRPRRDIPA